MFDMKRRLAVIAAVCACVALTACGDDTTVDNTGNNGGNDAGAGGDGGTVGDAGTGADTGTDDGGDGVCETPCASNRDCASLGTTFTCDEGCCVDGGGTEPLLACSAPGQACSDPSQTTAEYFCDTDAGECVTRCFFDDRFADDFGGCPLNTFCGAQLTGVEDGDPDGVCIPGDCDSNIFDETACEGTGTCTPLANGASFCFDAGTALEGDACNTDTSDNQPAGDICAAGLLCFDNVCEVPCNLRNGDDDCTGGESCLQVRDITPRNQPGVCGTACEPFGTCGEGEICDPQTGNLGINEWVCVPAGPNVAAAGEDCSAVGTRCEEGTLCINQGTTEAPDLVCEEVCATGDPTTGVYGACSANGDPIPGAEVLGLTAFGEASAYAVLPGDDYDVEVLTAENALVTATTVSVTAGEVTSLVYTWVDGGLDSFALTDLLADDVVPETGVRGVHASPDAGVVDIAIVTGAGSAEEVVIPVADGVEYGQATSAENGAYTALPAGDILVRLTLSDDSVVDSPTITISENTLYTLLAAGSVTDETFGFFVTVDVLPALAEGDGAVRLLHMADQAPAVSVNLPSTFADDFVCTPSTLDGLGFCNESCEPFPRDGDYGCEDPANSCLPFVAFDDRIVEPQGSCVETDPEANVERGGTCSPESFFFFNAECADYAVCFTTDETETEGVCTPLCEPFSTGQCDDIDMTCRGDLPLTGVLQYSLCTADFQAGDVGDRCDNGDDAEFFCEADGAMCFTFQQGATSGTCSVACRSGEEYDDCAPYGQVCVTGGLNPDVVPTYMGLCENP